MGPMRAWANLDVTSFVAIEHELTPPARQTKHGLHKNPLVLPPSPCLDRDRIRSWSLLKCLESKYPESSRHGISGNLSACRGGADSLSVTTSKATPTGPSGPQATPLGAA
ncbi:hypothetical protein VUR80DRAFT_7080 [Thermomyces stellatus]